MRAARAWSDDTADSWAAALGVSRATVHIYETRKEPPLEILRRAAERIGAPLAFMENGWAGIEPRSDPDPQFAARLDDLQRQLDELRGERA